MESPFIQPTTQPVQEQTYKTSNCDFWSTYVSVFCWEFHISHIHNLCQPNSLLVDKTLQEPSVKQQLAAALVIKLLMGGRVGVFVPQPVLKKGSEVEVRWDKNLVVLETFWTSVKAGNSKRSPKRAENFLFILCFFNLCFMSLLM